MQSVIRVLDVVIGVALYNILSEVLSKHVSCVDIFTKWCTIH